MEHNTVLIRHFVQVKALQGWYWVCGAKRNAEQELKVTRDAEGLANGVGIEADDCLRDPVEAAGGQRQEEILGIHTDVPRGAHSIAEHWHEEERGMWSAKESQVLPGDFGSAFVIGSVDTTYAVMHCGVLLGPLAVNALAVVEHEVEGPPAVLIRCE
jgi:hypothetical protein